MASSANRSSRTTPSPSPSLTTASEVPPRLRCGLCTRVLDAPLGAPLTCPCGGFWSVVRLRKHWMETSSYRRIS